MLCRKPSGLWHFKRRVQHVTTRSMLKDVPLLHFVSFVCMLCSFFLLWSRDSTFRTVTRMWAGWSRFDFQQRQQIFLFSQMSALALQPTQRPIQWVQGASYTGIKQLGQEVDQSASSGTQVKCDRSYPSTPSIHLHGVDTVRFNSAYYLLPCGPWR
jgi:hypothetical protein